MTATMVSKEVRTVSPQEASALLRERGTLLVDVREADEHNAERIAGAVLHPLSRFDAGAIPLHGRQRVVFHCRSGKRSAEAARLASGLQAAGVEVCSLDGGIEAWRSAGLPTIRTAGASRVSVMRQVQMTIGAGVLGGCAAAWFVDPRFVAIPAFFGAGLLFAGVTGTCGLASLLSLMPWNKSAACPVAQR